MNDSSNNSEIVIGSIVRFSSYYTFMTVESVKDENNIICIWFNKFGYLKREIFDIRTLSVYDFEEKESYQYICVRAGAFGHRRRSYVDSR